MKRFSIIAAAAIAALLSASCNKTIQTPEIPSTGERIILDLKIADPDGSTDTKALKKGWTAGDKLNLWFDDWNNTEKANNPTPDLVITYDGMNWTAGALAAGRSLKPSGLFLVMYESSNNLSGYKTDYHNGGVWFKPESNTIPPVYDRAYCSYMVRIQENVSYTFDGNKLTAVISGWNTISGFRVLVKDLNSAKASDYVLQASYVDASGAKKYVNAFGPIVILHNTTCPTYTNGSSNYEGYQGGVKDADGVAFYYIGSSFTNADIEFTLLKKNASGEFEKTAKAPKYTNKTLTRDGTKMVSIVIDKSKFE